jgi:hypothetical protein
MHITEPCAEIQGRHDETKQWSDKLENLEPAARTRSSIESSVFFGTARRARGSTREAVLEHRNHTHDIDRTRARIQTYPGLRGLKLRRAITRISPPKWSNSVSYHLPVSFRSSILLKLEFQNTRRYRHRSILHSDVSRGSPTTLSAHAMQSLIS